MMENWLDKYKPNNLNDVIGDKTQIQKIKQFVQRFSKVKFNPNTIPNPNLIITGTNGIGKTLITDLVLKEYGFEKVTADISTLSVARKTKRKKRIENKVISPNRTIKTYYLSLQNHKILSLNNEYVNTKVALVFDDVSNITNSKEKEAIKSLVKLNNKFKKFPIIIIANKKHSKTVNELKKMVTYSIKKINADGKKENIKITNEIILNMPNSYDLELFIKKICKQEGLNIIKKKSDEDDIYVEIISHTQYDIRRLINILEELKMIYEDADITLENFNKYRETSKTKDLDPGIYEATRMLLNRYTDMDNALALYGEERATIPLMVHENYPLNISQQYPHISLEEQIDLIFDISKCISESDKIDGLIYSNQCWSLQSVHGFYACVMPSYHINKLAGKKCKMETYTYTQDYNKTSIKKINNKVIKKAQDNSLLKKVSIYDFLHIAYILKILFEKKEYETVAELMKPYKLTLKEIESIIKIDKIKKSKNALTGKQKGLMKELLGVTE